LKFFFDNNLSPHMARGIAAMSTIISDVAEVRHLSDMFPRNTPDVEWIKTLDDTGPWCILSIDRFKKAHDAEREALRRSGHTVFVLDSQWAKQSYWLQCERLVRWWPQIIEQSRLVSAGAFRVPWAHSSGAKFQAIKL
jgi:hypothetical protein